MTRKKIAEMREWFHNFIGLALSRSPRPFRLIAPAFRDEALHGTGSRRTPAAVRLHYHLSLYFSAIDDGAGAAIGLPEDQSAAHRRSTLQSRGAILGADLRNQFCARRRHGHSDGISVWDELGGFLESGWRSNRTDAGDGRSVFIFSGIEFPGIVSFRRKTARANRTLGGWVSGIPGLLALGLFHRGDGRLDATPYRLPD